LEIRILSIFVTFLSRHSFGGAKAEAVAEAEVSLLFRISDFQYASQKGGTHMDMFIQILKGNRTFAEFTDEELNMVLGMCEKVKYPKGEIIFRENESDDASVYFIEEGMVQVSKTGKDKEKIIAMFGMGNIFGEMSFLDKYARSATVTALEATTVYKLAPGKMPELVSKSSRTAMKLLGVFIKKLTMRLRQTDEALVEQEDKIIVT
jgi:CRP-like cAMP-binding protein